MPRGLSVTGARELRFLRGRHPSLTIDTTTERCHDQNGNRALAFRVFLFVSPAAAPTGTTGVESSAILLPRENLKWDSANYWYC